MADSTNNKKLFTELFLTKIDELQKCMTFRTFKNDKPYSFDYNFKSKFNLIFQELKKQSLDSHMSISPVLSNKIPIFLPKTTSRISFFEYKTKSVRPVEVGSLETMLHRQALKQMRLGNIDSDEVDKLVQADLETFKKYDAKHKFTAYRTDIMSTTVQFNAYDNKDTLLLEKSAVKGGLVFDMKAEEFEKKVTISYPRYRKQRSDKKEEYIPLKFMKIRGITPKKSKN